LIPGIPYFNKNILICPLDWGLGHAARCVPLIRQLQKQNNRVVIGCTQWQKDFLQGEVDGAEYVSLFGYEVKYSEKIALGLKMLSQFPRLSLLVRKERAWLSGFLKKNKMDVVISDNRFGLYNKNVESVFITHQLFIPTPFFRSAVNKINFAFIKKYNSCWVPDHENEAASLSGSLCHNEVVPENVTYIGPLSRFSGREQVREKKCDVLALLSGVEPQRSALEEKITAGLAGTSLKVTLVRGTAKKGNTKFPDNFTVYDTVNTRVQEKLMLEAEKIICRSGYSTLMDLRALGLKAILVPTPGQTEQEYLAGYWNEKFGFHFVEQKQLGKMSFIDLPGRSEDPVPRAQSV